MPTSLPLAAQSALGIYGAPPLMIIETTDNRIYSVRETGNASLAHLWMGVEVKRSKAGFVLQRKLCIFYDGSPRCRSFPSNSKTRAREELVRKEGSRTIMAPVADPFSRIA